VTGHVETRLLFEASLKAQVLIVCTKFEVLTALTILSILMKEDTITSEKSVHIYQTTWCHIPKTMCFVTSSFVACCPNRPVT
jgi:hypothetical protein